MGDPAYPILGFKILEGPTTEERIIALQTELGTQLFLASREDIRLLAAELIEATA